MRHIKTEGPIDERYAGWRERARKARNKLIKEYEETKVTSEPDPKIWADLKDTFLRDVFCDKCAYCEAIIPKANFPAHVDHYRPKKRVKEKGTEVEHPGYFWLAYEWYNLLLVCHNCNSGHSEIVDGRKVPNTGKGDEFPISGLRVSAPSENPNTWRDELREIEKPLLLNPYDDTPESYISFGKAGVPFPINNDPRAVATIRVYHLDRIELCAERLAYAEEQVTRWLHRAAEIKEGGPCVRCFTPYSQFTLWLNVAVPLILRKKLEGNGLEVVRLTD